MSFSASRLASRRRGRFFQAILIAQAGRDRGQMRVDSSKTIAFFTSLLRRLPEISGSGKERKRANQRYATEGTHINGKTLLILRRLISGQVCSVGGNRWITEGMVRNSNDKEHDQGYFEQR
jgi:hypothetical protein